MRCPDVRHNLVKIFLPSLTVLEYCVPMRVVISWAKQDRKGGRMNREPHPR